MFKHLEKVDSIQSIKDRIDSECTIAHTQTEDSHILLLMSRTDTGEEVFWAMNIWSDDMTVSDFKRTDNVREARDFYVMLLDSSIF